VFGKDENIVFVHNRRARPGSSRYEPRSPPEGGDPCPRTIRGSPSRLRIECNRFSPVTTAADFEQDVDIRGNHIVSEARSGASITHARPAGLLHREDRTGQWTPVPLRVALAQPGGPGRESFFRIS